MLQFGIAMTDPDPLYHPERMTMFDPVPAPYNPDEHILPKASYFLGNLLRQSASTCTGICKVRHFIVVEVPCFRVQGQDLSISSLQVLALLWLALCLPSDTDPM